MSLEEKIIEIEKKIDEHDRVIIAREKWDDQIKSLGLKVHNSPSNFNLNNKVKELEAAIERLTSVLREHIESHKFIDDRTGKDSELEEYKKVNETCNKQLKTLGAEKKIDIKKMHPDLKKAQENMIKYKETAGGNRMFGNTALVCDECFLTFPCEHAMTNKKVKRRWKNKSNKAHCGYFIARHPREITEPTTDKEQSSEDEKIVYACTFCLKQFTKKDKCSLFCCDDCWEKYKDGIKAPPAEDTIEELVGKFIKAHSEMGNKPAESEDCKHESHYVAECLVEISCYKCGRHSEVAGDKLILKEEAYTEFIADLDGFIIEIRKNDFSLTCDADDVLKEKEKWQKRLEELK